MAAWPRLMHGPWMCPLTYSHPQMLSWIKLENVEKNDALVFIRICFCIFFVLVFDFVWMTKAMQGSISVTGSCNRADFTVWSTTEPKLIVHKEYVLPFHLSSLWMCIIHWNAARAQVFTKYEAKANIKSHLEQILSHWITAIRFGLFIFKSTSGHVYSLETSWRVLLKID